MTLPPRGGSRAPASPPGGSTRSPTHAAGGDSPDALRKELLREKERRARLERELLSQVTQCKRMEKALDTLRLGRVRPSLASPAAQPSPLCPSCAERERPVRRVVVPAPNRHALRRYLPLRSAVPRGRYQRDVIHQGHVAWATNAACCFHSDVCCAVLFSCACECCVCWWWRVLCGSCVARVPPAHICRNSACVPPVCCPPPCAAPPMATGADCEHSWYEWVHWGKQHTAAVTASASRRWSPHCPAGPGSSPPPWARCPRSCPGPHRSRQGRGSSRTPSRRG